MKIFYSLLFLFSVNFAHAQSNFTLRGTVVNEQQKAVLYGEAVLFDTDTVAVKYAIIENGGFAFDPLPGDKYLLRISSLGFAKEEQKIDLDGDKTLAFTLSESTNDLTEVTVTAERTAVSNEQGNLRVTVAGTVFATAPGTAEMLSMLPKIMVSNDRESISVIGQGAPLLYVGNQRITVQELYAIPVAEIKDIQIVDNPSAKYEADGRAVILVTLLKNTADGYKVNLSNNAIFRRRFNNYAGVNASFKRGKLEVKGNFNFNRLHTWEGSRTVFEVQDAGFSSDYTAFFYAPRPQYIFGGGAYYQLNKDDYISVNANGRLQSDAGPVLTETQVKFQNTNDRIDTINNLAGERSFLSSNFNYYKKLQAGSLFFGFQYTDYVRANRSDISNNVNETAFLFSQKRDQSFHIRSIGARLNYEHNLSENMKWEIGINLSDAKADAFAEFIFADAADEPEVTKYDYSEVNYAAFTQISGKVKKVTYSAGIRAEDNRVQGGFRTADTLLVDRKRLVFFPQATLTVPLDSTKTLTFNYLSNIRRPHYLNASTITTFINPYYEYSRNINLISSIAHSMSAVFQWKKQSLTALYRRTQDPFQNSIRYVEGENRVVARPDNFARRTELSLLYTNPLRLKKLTSTNTIGIFWSRITDPRAVFINTAQPYLYVYSDNQLKVTDKLGIGASFWMLSRQRQGTVITETMTRLGFNASYLAGEKLRISLNIEDIFRGSVWVNRTEINDITDKTIYFGDTRSIGFSLQYSFGKTLKSAFKNEAADENLRRIN